MIVFRNNLLCNDTGLQQNILHWPEECAEERNALCSHSAEAKRWLTGENLRQNLAEEQENKRKKYGEYEEFQHIIATKVNELRKDIVAKHDDGDIDKIVGNQYAVSGVLTGNGEISVSAVFPYIGEKSATQILKNISPKMNGDYAVVDENMKSNIDGLYFAGDIVDKKLKQLITASSDGAIAAVNVSKVNI